MKRSVLFAIVFAIIVISINLSYFLYFRTALLQRDVLSIVKKTGYPCAIFAILSGIIYKNIGYIKYRDVRDWDSIINAASLRRGGGAYDKIMIISYASLVLFSAVLFGVVTVVFFMANF
jgi:hypothetical protein